MLSRIELEFLKSPENFNTDYRRILRHRVKSKVQKIRSVVALLEAHGVSVTENCNGVTEFCNGQENQQSLNQAAFNKVAPGMGFEPMRTLRSTGSQGPRVNHSAIPALSESTVLIHSVLKSLPTLPQALNQSNGVFPKHNFDLPMSVIESVRPSYRRSKRWLRLCQFCSNYISFWIFLRAK